MFSPRGQVYIRPGRLPPNPHHLTPGVAASPAHVLYKSSGRACGCQCKFAVTPIYLAPSLQLDLSPHRGQFRGFWAKSGPETHRTGPRKVKEGCIYTFRAHPGPTTQGSSKTIARPMIFAPSVPITHYFVIQVSGSRLIYIYIYTFIHTRAHTRGRGLAHPADRPILICMKTMRHVCIYIYGEQTI